MLQLAPLPRLPLLLKTPPPLHGLQTRQRLALRRSPLLAALPLAVRLVWRHAPLLHLLPVGPPLLLVPVQPAGAS